MPFWKKKFKKFISQFTFPNVAPYLLGTRHIRHTIEVFKLDELWYFLLKTYPRIANLFHNPRQNLQLQFKNFWVSPDESKESMTKLLSLKKKNFFSKIYSFYVVYYRSYDCTKTTILYHLSNNLYRKKQWSQNLSIFPCYFVIVTRTTNNPKPPEPDFLTKTLFDFLNLWPWYQWVSSLITLIILYLVTGYYYNKWLSEQGGWLTYETRFWLIFFDLSLNLILGMYYMKHRETLMGTIMLRCPIAISPVIFFFELISIFIYYRYLDKKYVPYFHFLKKKDPKQNKIEIKQKIEEEIIEKSDQKINTLIEEVAHEIKKQMAQKTKKIKTEVAAELKNEIETKINEISQNIQKKINEKKKELQKELLERKIQQINEKKKKEKKDLDALNKARKEFEENEALFARKPGEPEYKDEDRIL